MISFYFKSARCDYFQCCDQFELFQSKILMKNLTWFTALLVFIVTVPINDDFHDIHHWNKGDYSFSSPYKKCCNPFLFCEHFINIFSNFGLDGRLKGP